MTGCVGKGQGQLSLCCCRHLWSNHTNKPSTEHSPTHLWPTRRTSQQAAPRPDALLALVRRMGGSAQDLQVGQQGDDACWKEGRWCGAAGMCTERQQPCFGHCTLWPKSAARQHLCHSIGWISPGCWHLHPVGHRPVLASPVSRIFFSIRHPSSPSYPMRHGKSARSAGKRAGRPYHKDSLPSYTMTTTQSLCRGMGSGTLLLMTATHRAGQPGELSVQALAVQLSGTREPTPCNRPTTS